MTTALFGKSGAATVKARVALVGKEGNDLVSTLERQGHEVLAFEGWDALSDFLTATVVDLVLCEGEPDTGRAARLPVPVLQVGHSSARASVVELALEQMLGLAVELRQATVRCEELGRLVDGVRSGSALAGNSPVMRRLQGSLSRAADSEVTVLLEGPAGSGKSLAARIIHCKSRRSDKRLEAVECADLDADAMGKAIETSRGGTLVLEGIERLPAASQSVLVRHMKERASTPARSVRLIATTSAHLPELVARGTFREDLYYRLHAFPIVVPALRERTEDVPAIAQSILDAAQQHHGRSQTFTPAALMLLESMPWPGNVAQLAAAVRRAMVLAGGGTIDRDHVAPVDQPAMPLTGRAPAADSDRTELDAVPAEDSVVPFEEEEQRILSRALRATKGNVRRAAQLLGIGRATLYRKIQQYKLRLH